MTEPSTANVAYATPRVCGARTYLPGRLVPMALKLARTTAGDGDPNDVQRMLRCPLTQHHDGPHHGFVMDLDGVDTGSVWTPWRTGDEPALVMVLGDCPGRSQDGTRACEEFAGHPGAHTWQLPDPWSN